MKKALFGLTILMFGATANGASTSITADKSVTSVSVYDTSAVVYFTPGQANNQGCTETRQDAVKIDLTVESGVNMLSTVLTAAAAEKTIGFGVNGCLEANLPKVYRVDVNF